MAFPTSLRASATTKVVRVLVRTELDEGLRLEAVTEREAHEMGTVAVRALDAGMEA